MLPLQGLKRSAGAMFTQSATTKCSRRSDQTSQKRLRNFIVGRTFKEFLHDGGVASSLVYGVTACTDRKRIDDMMQRSGSVLGCPLESVTVVVD